MQTNIAGDRRRGAHGEAGAQAGANRYRGRRAAPGLVLPRRPPARSARSVLAAGAGGSPCSLCGKRRAPRGRGGGARPPWARARGLSAADLSPLPPPAASFAARPLSYPQFPAPAALLPRSRFPPPPALPPPPGKTRGRRRRGDRPAPRREGGTCGVPVAAAVTAGEGRGWG